jgi:cob(I)alamin adenosyltransferase
MTRRGLVIVNTGHGKGKTTAAVGMLVRAHGHGLRTRMFQFIKSPDREYGETLSARKLGIEVAQLGDGFTSLSKDLDATRDLAIDGWAQAAGAILSGDYDLVVLDELTYAFKYGWLDVLDVIAILRQRSPAMHVVITGRDAPEELIAFADLVTEMTLIKHPFREQGIPAQQGVDF